MGVDKKYIDDNYLKLSGGTVTTGHTILNNTVLTSQYQALSWTTGNAFVQYPSCILISI